MKKVLNRSVSKLVPVLLAPLLIAAAGMVDPTRPPNFSVTPHTAAGPSQALQVTAIFIYPHYQLAIINGQSVMVGDKINDFIVTSISHDAVELTGPENEKESLPLTMDVKQRKE